jgi:hypothetical protein
MKVYAVACEEDPPLRISFELVAECFEFGLMGLEGVLQGRVRRVPSPDRAGAE